jgi:RNA polymerase sigma-70 factor (ECF subfamily)
LADQKIVELARKAIKGDQRAFEELIRARQRGLLFSAYTILKNSVDAEDAVQEAILKMYRHIGKLRSPETFHAWSERIVRNESLRIYKTRSVQNDEADIDDEGVDIAEDSRDLLPDAYAEDSALRDLLYQKVLSLPTAKREVIIMYYYEDLSYKEIAQITGTAINTVSSNLNKARTALKKKLSGADSMVNGMVGLSSTSAVISKSLKSEAISVVPDEQLIAFEQRWLSAVRSAPMPNSGKSKSVAKAVIAAVLSVAVFVGVIFAVSAPGEDIAANDANTGGALIGREIAFSDGDCECGHINPGVITMENLDKGDRISSWNIVSKADGESIFSGDEAALDIKIHEMIAGHENGDYTLNCNILDKNGHEVTVKRAFTIENAK